MDLQARLKTAVSVAGLQCPGVASDALHAANERVSFSIRLEKSLYQIYNNNYRNNYHSPNKLLVPYRDLQPLRGCCRFHVLADWNFLPVTRTMRFDSSRRRVRRIPRVRDRSVDFPRLCHEPHFSLFLARVRENQSVKYCKILTITTVIDDEKICGISPNIWLKQ